MNRSKKILLGVTVFGIGASLTVSTGSVLASDGFQRDRFQLNHQQGRYKNLDEETTANLKEVYALKKAGDMEGAKEIMKDLDLSGKFRKQGKGNFKKGRHPAEKGKMFGADLRTAIEEENYEAWAEIMSNHPKFFESSSQDVFNKILQINELKKSGDKEGVRALTQELRELRKK